MNVVPFEKLKVVIITAHGKEELDYTHEDTIISCLNKNNIPWSGVSVYKLTKDNELLLYPMLESKINSLKDVKELQIFFNRNINPFLFSLNNLKIIESSDVSSENPLSSEYIYQNIDNTNGVVSNYLKKLSQTECQKIITDCVSKFIETYLKKEDSIVVGISGGGDSNALLNGLMSFNKFKINVIPFILKGTYDWDQGVPRAQQLCDKYNLKLTVIDDDDVKKVLNYKSKKDIVARFEEIFPGDDFEFLGTLLIRLVLINKAKELNVKYICTGLNLEDVLCESLYRISNSLPPSPFPVRDFGKVSLLYPLWECPKRIIDGCFPKFSLENYEARYPCFSLGRNVYYQMAYLIQSQIPGISERFLYGLQSLSNKFSPKYTFDEEFNFIIEREVPKKLRERFNKLLKGST